MKTFFFVFLLFPVFLFSQQFVDDFEDGDISDWTQSSPNHWTASSSNPLDGFYSLHQSLDTNASFRDMISHPLSGFDLNGGTTTWQFRVKYSYNPSSSNDWSFFLVSNQDANQMYPSGSANGYAVGVNYSGSDDIIKIWKISNGGGSVILNSNFNWQDSISTDQSVGIKVVRTATGDWSLFIDTTNVGFDNLMPIGDTVNDVTYANASYVGVYYEYTSSADIKLWLDDISVTGSNTNNGDSYVSAGPDTEPASISSLTNSADGVEVFDVNLSDAGTSDGATTIINSLTFTQGSANDVSDWTQAIAGAKLFGDDISQGIEGVVNENSIVFNDSAMINIADGQTEHYKLYIWLKSDLSNITDNDNLEFRLDYNNILCDASGSYFGSGEVESGDNNNAISIVATNLKITYYPQSIKQNTDFSLTVNATDINGNRDIDATGNVTVQATENSGQLSSSSGLSLALDSGKCQWADLQYNEIDTFKIVAHNSSFTDDTTGNISCAEFFYFLDDDFEDSDLVGWDMKIPDSWAASDDEPITGNYSLHQVYDDSISEADAISFALANVDLSADSLIWRFNVKYKNSNPSGSNNWNVFLTADADNSQMYNGGAINGYVLGVNFSGSNDTIYLWRVDNGSATKLINTGIDWKDYDKSLPKSFLVSRSQNGDWKIYFDEDGGYDNFDMVGSATDATYTRADYFGVLYNYTSSMDRELWLDDIYFGEPIPDVIPPKIITQQAVSPNKLNVKFNEEIDPVTAQLLTNYSVDNSIGNPQGVTLVSPKKVELSFTNSFVDSTLYSVSVQNIQDKSGNVINDTSVTFSWTNIAVARIKFISNTKLNVVFSKNVDEATAQDTSNYYVNNQIGNPVLAKVDSLDSTIVHLTFTKQFVSGNSYSIHIKNIEDRLGNIIDSTDFPFVFYIIQPYDVVINELMIDVSPAPAALPPYKYIELYNKTNYDFDLTAWSMTIGTNSPISFVDNTILPANSYLIICSSDAEANFTTFGKTMPILKESQLTSTTGKMIRIYDRDGNIIDEITYSPDWYGDPDKAKGGWSLERIDYDNVCNQDNNWTASINQFGGTPGIQNSVYQPNPDTEHPHVTDFYTVTSQDMVIDFSEIVDTTEALNFASYVLNNSINPVKINFSEEDRSIFSLHYADHFNFGDNALKIKNIKDYCDNVLPDTTINFNYLLIHPVSVEPISGNQLIVRFSEPVDLSTAENIYNYSVDNGLGNPSVAFRNSSDTSEVYLMFTKNFPEDTSLTLSISNIKDLNGNVMNNKSLDFVYHLIHYNDIVINEVLFNPYSGGSDFVELYNRGKFKVYLNKLKIAKRDIDSQIVSITPIANDYIELDTGEFLVISADTANIKKLYTTGGKFVQIKSMPSMPDDEGNIIILDTKGTIVDEFNYSADMHFKLLSDVEGVSLERIDYNMPTQDSSNWHSAAESVGFATPGLKNSQYKNTSIVSPIGEISIDRNVLSPDNDGTDDQLYINYSFDNIGYVADVYIFNKNGYPVRHLVNNQTISDKGFWTWDGLDDNNFKVNIGIYAVIVKIFDLDGNVHVYKKACVVSTKK